MKPSLLLLHGAIGTKDQLLRIAGELQNDFNIHLINFPGHGDNRTAAVGFSIDMFALSVKEYMEANQLLAPVVFGYSMGGYVALYLEKYYPGIFGKIITLGTKFHWDTATAEKEIKMLQPEIIEQKVPAFASSLQKMHTANDWKTVLSNTADMMKAMGENNPLQPEDYNSITAKVMIMLGDRDNMVTVEETVNVYKQLPNADMAILPATGHPIEKADPEMLRYFLCRKS